MSRSSAIVAWLIALGAVLPAAALASPIRFRAWLDRGARLGGSSGLHTDLSIDTRRVVAPVTQVRLLYPADLGVVSSDLGLASCRQPPDVFQAVLTEGVSGLDGCSPNAVLGLGTAEGDVRLASGQVIPEYATLSLLTGEFARGTLGLVAFVFGERPFGARLVYGGDIRNARGAFGGVIVLNVPPIPSIADLATVALTHLRLTIGSHAIVYYAHPRIRTGPYHPAGVVLPARCPRHGFPFRVLLRFADGTHSLRKTSVRCPAR